MGQDGKKLKPPVIGAFRYGTMTGAEFAPSKKYDHPDIKLIGDWEGEGLGYWYANWKAVTALARAGLLEQLPGDGKKFQAVTGYRFCIWRSAGEGDAHDWFAAAYDAQGQTVELAAFTEPVEPAMDAGAATPPPATPPATAAAPPPPGQPGGPLTEPAAGQPGAPVAPPPPAQGPTPPVNGSTAEQRAEDKAKRHRQTLAKVDALYGLALVVTAYQQVRFFNLPAKELGASVLQAGAATVMIALERSGYDPETDCRPAYLKRLRRLEYSLFPDQCPDPDPAKPAGEKEEKKPNRAKPKEPALSEENPGPEPPPVSTVPGAEFAGEADDGFEDGDDLPF